MAIVIRIVSADGKKAIMKSLPALPAHIKVPAGARVEVTERGETKSLSQYVNEHANRDPGGEVRSGSKIVVETAESWASAEAWLDSLSSLPPPDKDSQDPSDPWFTAPDHSEHRVAGFQSDALLIGGAAVAGAGFSIYALTKDDGNKDRVAPAAPTALDLATDDDNGLSTSDNITTKTTGITVTGTAEAGSTVELFDGTTSLGTVTADTKGVFTKDIDLAPGEHNITAKATDNAGNLSIASSALKIIVDTTAPTAPTALDLAIDDDTGASNTDNVTNKTSGLTITGKSEANARIELFDGTTSLGTVTAATDGTFTKDISLAAGVHSITAKATDAAGNVGVASEVLTITVDSSAAFSLDLASEDDTGTSNNDNITSKTSALTISGTITPNATVELFDGTTSLGTATTNANGLFTKDISLAAGNHDITAKVANSNGVSDVLKITVDPNAPTAPASLDLLATDDTGVSDTDNITSKVTGLTITGIAEANSTVELFDGSMSLGLATANSSGVWSKLISQFGVGEHTITAKASDAAGNVSVASNALIIVTDPNAPAVPTALDLAADDDTGASNTDNLTSKTSGLTISGNAEAGSTVELFDGSTSLGTIVADSNSLFTLDISLAAGLHQITAKATDVAGNVSGASTSLQITVQEAAQASSFAAMDASLSDLDHLALHNSSSSFA